VIVSIDCDRLEIVRAYEIHCAGPHGLWLDRGRLFCAADGGELGTTTTEAGAHTLGVDPLSHHVYVFCPGSSGAAVYAPA
jgi:hypothetical protein